MNLWQCSVILINTRILLSSATKDEIFASFCTPGAHFNYATHLQIISSLSHVQLSDQNPQYILAPATHLLICTYINRWIKLMKRNSLLVIREGSQRFNIDPNHNTSQRILSLKYAQNIWSILTVYFIPD